MYVHLKAKSALGVDGVIIFTGISFSSPRHPKVERAQAGSRARVRQPRVDQPLLHIGK